MILILTQGALGALQLAAWLTRWGRPWFSPPAWVDAVALAALLAAGALAGAAAISLRKTFGVHPRPRPGGFLVRSGVYTYLRHPMYLSVLLVCLALLLRWPSIPLALATVANVVFYFAKARYEERLLTAHYPDYSDYRAHTWGIVPWPRRER